MKQKITGILIKGANGIGGQIRTSAKTYDLGESDPQHLVLGLFTIALAAYERGELVEIEEMGGKISSITIPASDK